MIDCPNCGYNCTCESPNIPWTHVGSFLIALILGMCLGAIFTMVGYAP